METNHRFLAIEWVCRMFQATTQAIKWFFIVGTFFLSKSTNSTTWHNKSSKCPCTTFRLGGSQLIEKLLRINWCWKKQEPQKLCLKLEKKDFGCEMVEKTVEEYVKSSSNHVWSPFQYIQEGVTWLSLTQGEVGLIELFFISLRKKCLELFLCWEMPLFVKKSRCVFGYSSGIVPPSRSWVTNCKQ